MNTSLTFREKMDLLTAFVSMEQALNGHLHNWTSAEREAYEKALSVIGIINESPKPNN